MRTVLDGKPSMQDPCAGYVVLLWCRDCGHLATRPRVAHEALPDIHRRARCGKCRGRNIGARLTYEPRLPGPGGLLIWELQMIAQACAEAAERARAKGAAIPHGGADSERQRLDSVAMTYARLAGYYWAEAQSRKEPPGAQDHVAKGQIASHGKQDRKV